MKKNLLSTLLLVLTISFTIKSNAQVGVTKLGDHALEHNTTSGIYNTGLGYYSLNANTNGNHNTATGALSLRNNITGIHNTASGAYSMYLNTSGSSNTASGFDAMYNNSTGWYNSGFGMYSLNKNTTGYYNSASGYAALYSNTTGYYNTAVGYEALYSNTDQSYNTAIGPYALFTNTDGVANTAIGYRTLFANTGGISNTGIGHAALYLNTTGNNNNAVGRYALYNNLTGSNNDAFGYQAIYFNKSGSDNVAFGYNSLYNDSTGSGNTAVGYSALSVNKTGNNNTAIGNAADVSKSNLTNATAIGYNAKATAKNQVRIGNSAVTSIGGYVTWSNISDGRVKKNIKENVPGLVFINKLKPVTYNLDLEAADRIMQPASAGDKNVETIQLSTEEIAARKTKEQVVYTGFVAQDVEKAAKQLAYNFSGVDAAKDDKDLYGLRYSEFVVPLVKAVQELSRTNDDLKDQLTAQQKEIDALKVLIVNKSQTNSSANAMASTETDASLLQNVPNPFNNATTIYYSLPQKFTNAQIVINDNNGKQLKQFNLSYTKGSVTLNASSLSPGMYYYSLFADGKKIETKQMVLAK